MQYCSLLETLLLVLFADFCNLHKGLLLIISWTVLEWRVRKTLPYFDGHSNYFEVICSEAPLTLFSWGIFRKGGLQNTTVDLDVENTVAATLPCV